MKNVINSFASMKFNKNYKILQIDNKMVRSVKKVSIKNNKFFLYMLKFENHSLLTNLWYVFLSFF